MKTLKKDANTECVCLETLKNGIANKKMSNHWDQRVIFSFHCWLLFCEGSRFFLVRFLGVCSISKRDSRSKNFIHCSCLFNTDTNILLPNRHLVWCNFGDTCLMKVLNNSYTSDLILDLCLECRLWSSSHCLTLQIYMLRMLLMKLY